MNIKVTQADIDTADPKSTDKNCVALAIRRAKPRAKIVKVWAIIGEMRIGKRKYDLADVATHRLILHQHGYAIEPFEFEFQTGPVKR